MKKLLLCWLVCVSCQSRQEARPASTTAPVNPVIQQPPPPKSLPKTAAASASYPTRAKLTTSQKTLAELIKESPHVTANWPIIAENKLVFSLHLLGVSDFNPIVLRQEGGAWSATTFSDDFHGHAWKDAIYIPKTKTVVAVLDFEAESSGPQLEILSSQDHGQTWSQATITKPYYLSAFIQLESFADGALRISVSLEDDYGSGNKAGLYQYMSTDGGATWSKPFFSEEIPSVSTKRPQFSDIRTEKDLDMLFP